MKTGWAALLLGCFALGTVACIQPAESTAPLTGDLAMDQWVRATFGQPVDPETLDDPVWGTNTLLSLTDPQREGARLFRQRCNVCHGVSQNANTSYGPLLAKNNIEGRQEFARGLIMDGTARMPAFRYGLEASQIDMIVDYLATVEEYVPAY